MTFLMRIGNKYQLQPAFFVFNTFVSQAYYDCTTVFNYLQFVLFPVEIREAVINAIVHNDYSKEVPPKFEIFSDRLEIASAGSLPEGLDEKEFFEGYSVPRNKEIMRIFKDLEMVEHLGSGVPRILESYSEDCFKFSNNFIRMSFPVAEGVTLTQPHAMKIISITDSDKNGGQIGGQMELTKRQKDVLKIINEDNQISRNSISIKLGINESAVQKHLAALKNKGVLERIGDTGVLESQLLRVSNR